MMKFRRLFDAIDDPHDAQRHGDPVFEDGARLAFPDDWSHVAERGLQPDLPRLRG